MLVQLNVPVQAVVAFTASVCEDRQISKEAKAAILAVLDELAKDLNAAPGKAHRERSDSKLMGKSPQASERGQLMTGYLYKQCGHAVGQDASRPYPVNVGSSRVWKRFWFELKQNELVYFPAGGRDQTSMPSQRMALHELELR